MKSLLLFILFFQTCGWAENLFTKYPHSWEKSEVDEVVYNSKEWVVTKGSETYTLNEFMKSGKFCEWRGEHEWEDRPIFYPEYLGHDWHCGICGKKRKWIAYKVPEGEWEK